MTQQTFTLWFQYYICRTGKWNKAADTWNYCPIVQGVDDNVTESKEYETSSYVTVCYDKKETEKSPIIVIQTAQ